MIFIYRIFEIPSWDVKVEKRILVLATKSQYYIGIILSQNIEIPKKELHKIVSNDIFIFFYECLAFFR